MTINDLDSNTPFWNDLVRLNSENYLDHIHPDDLPQIPTSSKDWREQDELLEQQLQQNSNVPQTTFPINMPTSDPLSSPLISTPSQKMSLDIPFAPTKPTNLPISTPENISFQPYFDNEIVTPSPSNPPTQKKFKTPFAHHYEYKTKKLNHSMMTCTISMKPNNFFLMPIILVISINYFLKLFHGYHFLLTPMIVNPFLVLWKHQSIQKLTKLNIYTH